MKFPLIPTIDLSPLGETQHCSLMGMCVANVDIQYFWCGWEWGVREGLPRGGVMRTWTTVCLALSPESVR